MENFRLERPAALHGYVGSQNKVQVSTLSGSVSNVTIALPLATALFYGSVLDSLNNPLTGVVAVYASDNNGLYEGDGYTDTNGNYAVGTVGGLGGGDTWQVQIDNSSSYPNYVFSQPAFEQNGGTNLSVGQAVQANFTATLASNSISGSLTDNSGNALANIGIFANTTNGGNQNVDTDSNGNYSMNVANGTWTVNVNSGGGNNSLSSTTYLPPPNQTVVVANSNVTQLNFVAVLASNSISGSLKDNSGTAIANVGIYAYATISNVNYNQNVNTDNNGNYSLGVINGSWTVGVNSCSDCGGGSLPSNYLTPTNQNQTVVISNNNPTLNFIAILATNVISGNVQYNGTNVAGVGVSANLINNNNVQAYVDTDSNGNYSLYVNNGSWSVSVNCQGGNDSLAGILNSDNFACPDGTNVTIANDSVSGVNFNVQSDTTLLSGRVVDDGGNPVANMNVFASSTNGGGNPFQATTDSGGNFNMGIDGGSYTIQLNNDTNSGFPALGLVGPSVPVSVTDGVNISNFILVAPRVTGTIQVQVNGSNSLGLSGIRVSANLVIGITNYSTSGQDSTGNSGAAAMRVCNGTWTVSLNGNDVTSAGYPVPAAQNATISNNTNTLTFNLSNGGGSPLQVTTGSLPNGVESVFYSAQIQVIGGVPFTNGFPYNASLFSGSYPPGLTLSQGTYSNSSAYFVLSGTPTNSGTYPFDVVVSDSMGNQATNSYAITIAPSYSIVVIASPGNGGNVSGSGTFVAGSTNTVTATANSGYLFTDWTVSNTVVSASSNYTFVLNNNVTIVANFVQGYTLAVTASPPNGGNVSGGGTFLAGSTNIVTATANGSYLFTNWTVSNIVVSISSNYIVILTNNETIVANFLPLNTIAVSASPTNGGIVSGGGTFVSGTTNMVTAAANGNYAFIDWTSNGVVVSSSNDYAFTLNSNVALVAHFLPLYTLSVSGSPTNGGMVGGGGTFVSGTTNTVTATATNGFIFTNWTVSNIVVSTSSNYNVVLTNNETIVANFLPLYTITVGVSPPGDGTAGGGGTFVSGTTNTVTATATNGFIFTGWTVSNVVVSALATTPLRSATMSPWSQTSCPAARSQLAPRPPTVARSALPGHSRSALRTPSWPCPPTAMYLPTGP